ncbi:MAG TPA: aminotransferase class III-fold pyridoxal phosphate-dependent enzyme, partial [Chroococcidiopsis sp.]
ENPPSTDHTPLTNRNGAFNARIVIQDIPSEMFFGQTYICCLYVENIGTSPWFPATQPHAPEVSLAVFIDHSCVDTVALRQEVYPKSRCHFVFEIQATQPLLNLSLILTGKQNKSSAAKAQQIELLSKTIDVHECTQAVQKSGAVNLWEKSSEYVSRWLHTYQRLTSQPNKIINSQKRAPYAVKWLSHNLPQSWDAGGLYQVYLCIQNQGSRTWSAEHAPKKQVYLAVYINNKLSLQPSLPHDVAPGAQVILSFPLRFPTDSEDGAWELKFSLIEKQVVRFENRGVEPFIVKVAQAPVDQSLTAQANAIAQQSNSAFYQPSQGIIRSRNGSAYPLFVQQAKGCRIWDLEGHEWIDYVMGWGACLLGYAHPDIQAAIASQLDTGAVLSLPHALEIQLTQMLCELIPSAERVLFGKNGSDVCTAAIRIARLYTQRQKILVSGYSGWHDWNLQDLAPELIAPNQPKDIHRFSLNNLTQFCQLIKQYSGEIAAVILEPAAQVEGVDGPVRDVDPTFLRHVAEICREQSVILIFDEIMTGFRYAQGSVQKATGVIPDLSCFGKALTSGMPLSVLVGKRQIMDPVLSRIFYHPTFKGEAYSLAAAIAALQIYQNQDIPKQIWQFGTRLKQSINQVSQELGIAGQMVGLPYRMVYKFSEPRPTERTMMRTLLNQHLLQRGILTFRGFMLPSAAHGNEELEKTVDSYRSALQLVQQASQENSFTEHLEIPLIL